MNWKRLIVIVPAVAALLICRGWLYGLVVQKYVSPEAACSIEVPSGWRIVKDTPRLFVAYRPRAEPEEIAYEHIVLRTADVGGDDFNADYLRHLEDLDERLKDLTIVSQSTDEIGGVEVRRLDYSFRDSFLSLAVLARARQWLIFRNRRMYLITGIATVDSFQKYAPLFRNIAESFHLLEEKGGE